MEGNLDRTCLPMLVWSGRRPTCELICESKNVKCKQCKGETDSGRYCSSVSGKENVGSCINRLGTPNVLSIAKVDEKCYEYECKAPFKGWSDKLGDWTFHETCAKGSVSS